MKIIINGAGGRMGKEVVRLAEEGFGGASVAAKVDISYETNGDENKKRDFYYERCGQRQVL